MFLIDQCIHTFTYIWDENSKKYIFLNKTFTRKTRVKSYYYFWNTLKIHRDSLMDAGMEFHSFEYAFWTSFWVFLDFFYERVLEENSDILNLRILGVSCSSWRWKIDKIKIKFKMIWSYQRENGKFNQSSLLGNKAVD